MSGQPYLHASHNYYGHPHQPQQTQQQPAASSGTPLQFYSGPTQSFYGQPGGGVGMGGGLEGNMAMGGGAQGVQNGYGGNIVTTGPWWTAFGPGGVEGEPPLLEELGVNFSHIGAKAMTVLNPLKKVDEHIMDDADMAGPIVILLSFATVLLLSGKAQFGVIYGFGLVGSMSIYFLLNAMSEHAIDAYRVASVLGYCLLPMVGVGAMSVGVRLDRGLGYFLSLFSILWCTYAASGIFVSVLRMSDQRLLIAYPIGLLYGCFALLSVFNVSGVNTK